MRVQYNVTYCTVLMMNVGFIQYGDNVKQVIKTITMLVYAICRSNILVPVPVRHRHLLAGIQTG
jgi:hypothetical protein